MRGFQRKNILTVMILLAVTMAMPGLSVRLQAAENAAAAEDQGTVSPPVEELSGYKEISKTFALNDQDSFGSISVDLSDTSFIKDGEEGRLEEEFDASRKEARQAVRSEKDMESFLEEKDPETLYHVEADDEGKLEITAPYQTRRLIVSSILEGDTYGASRVYYNTDDHETILEFDSQEQTKHAYEQVCRQLGDSACFVDEIYYVEDLLQEEPGTQVPAAPCLSWGNRYMQMNQLKSKAAAGGYGGKVTVAVIDSGICRTNPLFSGGRVLDKGWNFVSGSPDISDYKGHGSHVAGIICDATPANVRILVLKVTDIRGRASLYAVKNALRYAIRQKVQVINMSMGVTGEQAAGLTYLNDAIREARNKKIPICAAAGNDGVDVKYSYPANQKIPITVTAINADGTRGSSTEGKVKAIYANYGNTIDFSAPGTSIISAGRGGDFYYMTGTSMAAPHVTAAIAYLKLLKPDISVKDVENQLKSMSRDFGPKGKDKYFGWGCPIMGNLFATGIKKTSPEKTGPGQVSISGLFNKKKGVRISWKLSGKADGFKIYRSTSGGKFKKIAKVRSGKRSYMDTKTLQGRKYTYKIKAYKGKTDGTQSQGQTMIRQAGVSKFKIKRISAAEVTLSWKKNKKVSGYEILCSSSKSAANGTLIRVTGNNRKTISGLLSPYCFLQIRTYRTSGGKTYYSAWSGMKRIRMR